MLTLTHARVTPVHIQSIWAITPCLRWYTLVPLIQIPVCEHVQTIWIALIHISSTPAHSQVWCQYPQTAHHRRERGGHQQSVCCGPAVKEGNCKNVGKLLAARDNTRKNCWHPGKHKIKTAGSQGQHARKKTAGSQGQHKKTNAGIRKNTRKKLLAARSSTQEKKLLAARDNTRKKMLASEKTQERNCWQPGAARKKKNCWQPGTTQEKNAGSQGQHARKETAGSQGQHARKQTEGQPGAARKKRKEGQPPESVC